MITNDNAHAIVYTVSISTGTETASRDVALDGIPADVATADVVEALLISTLNTMDLLLENQVSFSEIASLVRASKAMPTGATPLFALNLDREKLLMDMFKKNKLMDTEDPEQGLKAIRETFPSEVLFAEATLDLAIKHIAAALAAQMSAPEGKPH